MEDVRNLILIVIEKRMGGKYVEEHNAPMHNAIYGVGVLEDIRTLILAWEENMSRRTMHQRTLPTPPIEDGLWQRHSNTFQYSYTLPIENDLRSLIETEPDNLRASKTLSLDSTLNPVHLS